LAAADQRHTGRGRRLRELLLQAHPQQGGEQQHLKLQGNPTLAQVEQVQSAERVFPGAEE
jgi:hypothetical protein